MWRSVIVVVLASTVLDAQNNYFANGSRPLSAFVTAEYLIWQPGEMELIVLWRGVAPRWYSGSRSTRGSGTAQGYTGSIQFGPQAFDVQYDRARKVVRIRNTETSLARGENVLLVDGADRAGEPAIKAIRSDLTYTVVAGRGSAPAQPGDADFIAIADRSPEIVSFLRCDDPATNQIPEAGGLVCRALKSR
jgi:hypothetical protein